MIPHYLKSGTITKTGRMISSYSDRIGGGSFKAKGAVYAKALDGKEF